MARMMGSIMMSGMIMEVIGPDICAGQLRPYRRQAGSHRYSTGLGRGAVPVGAGLPAIGPQRLVQSSDRQPYHPSIQHLLFRETSVADIATVMLVCAALCGLSAGVFRGLAS